MQANTPYSGQVYKDPVFACTMATKAVWAELARKRCTLLKSSPGSPQHGSWFCGKRDWTFQRHARLLTTKGLHRFQRKDVWKLLQTPSSKAKTHHDNTNENPFMSKWIRGCTQQVRAGAADLLHQQYPSDRCSHDYSTPGRLSGYHELVFYGLWWISRTSIHGFINQPIVT